MPYLSCLRGKFENRRAGFFIGETPLGRFLGFLILFRHDSSENPYLKLKCIRKSWTDY